MISYRDAGVDDAYDIAYVNVHTWKSTYTGLIDSALIEKRISGILFRTEKLKEALSRKNNFIVAVDEDTVVGYVTYGHSRNVEYQTSGEIGALYLLREYQGKGIGKTLFTMAVSKLMDEGYHSMILNCLQGNSTLSFYEKMGGNIVSSQTEVINGHTVINEDVIYYDDLEKILENNKTHQI